MWANTFRKTRSCANSWFGVFKHVFSWRVQWRVQRKKTSSKNKYIKYTGIFCISFCICICSRVHTFVLMFKFGRWSTSTTFWRITRSTGAGFKNISGFINYFSSAQNVKVHLISLFPRFQISKHLWFHKISFQ